MVNIEAEGLGGGGEKVDRDNLKVVEVSSGGFKSEVDLSLESDADKKFYRDIKAMAERLLQEGYEFRLYDDNMTVAVEYPSGKVRHFHKIAQFPQSDSNPSIHRPIEEVIEKAIKEDSEIEKNKSINK